MFEQNLVISFAKAHTEEKIDDKIMEDQIHLLDIN